MLIGLLLFFLIFFFSCNKNTFNTQEELLAFLNKEQNGYIHHKMVNGIDFTLLYKPTDLLIKQELGYNIQSDSIKSIRKRCNRYLYFSLSMSRNSQELLSSFAKNRGEFGAMVNQLAFGMEDKIHLFTQSKDTLGMVDYVYPRMYGMSRSTKILFVFEKSEDEFMGDYLNFTIEDFGINTGEVKFRIDAQKIKNQPKLTFKK